jgi:hypothetical protein
MLSQITINQERKSIPTKPKNLSTLVKDANKKCHEYGLNQIIFDPTQNSPPNNFMVKLRERMTVYR